MEESVPTTTEQDPVNCEQYKFENESIVSDRCWEPQYRTDSHKWLTRDGNPHNPNERVSTMKDSFLIPQEELPVMGKRSRLLLEKMRREAEAEALAESAEKPTVEDYMTTYDDTFCPPDPKFHLKPPIRQRELYEKYPLYDNPPMTFWNFQHSLKVSERPAVSDAMVVENFNQPFKRCTRFSKPIKDFNDGGLLL